ncbi:Zn(II)2Cys6 transcription factor [Aspergillus homomorphus CBS 101889]|uniref:Zn(2)-C6 fungal-type domain-containing protein n=1 Tax=Aspergillus homomorphus (strain CBS 101889) TaxID=1450537 RepID=A0A395HVU0_ASPHC|nr:hypothetical protein BO97DRAFT_392908 [Aspergillus homomorphus CBS 101889]RAL10958.1 hypothetical protein BO97DRAFT_392908 [Aspergillus homomorphus CBS 101889]
MSLPSRAVPRRRYVTTACFTCRSRKVKCSGEQPCSHCVANNLECKLDSTVDQRRTTDLKRKLDSLGEDHDLLLRLVRTLRHNNAYIDELVDYIRNRNPSLSQIKAFMDGSAGRDEMEKTPELLGVYQEIDQLHRVPARDTTWASDMDRLCGLPLFSVPAKPWTEITDDDEFVSHLVSLWFTWHHSSFNCIDKDLFLRDMKSGVVDSPFCSPFLVNAILAEACFYPAYPETDAVRGDLSTKGEGFYNEAKRLLDVEESRISITAVQGMGVMYSCTSTMGKDRQGWVYLVRVSNAVRMLRSSQAQLLPAINLPGATWTRILDNLERGLFSTTTMSCLALQKPPQMNKPTSIRLPVHQDKNDLWMPYPLQDRPCPAHTNCVSNERTNLGGIAWEVAHYCFASSDKPPRADIEAAVKRWHEQLLDWATNLPECLAYTDQAMPWVLSLHMYHHTLIMTIYAFLKTPPPDADEATLESASSARQQCMTSARTVSGLVGVYWARWGMTRMTCSDMQCITMSLYTLKDDLDDEKSHQAFRALRKTAMPFCERWLILKGIFLVQISTMQTKENLPKDCLEISRDFGERPRIPETRESDNDLYSDLAIAFKQQIDYSLAMSGNWIVRGKRGATLSVSEEAKE